LLCEPMPLIEPGLAGAPSVSSSASIPGSLKWGSRSFSYKSLPTATAWATLCPVVGPCGLAWWREPFGRWARCWPVWGPKTPVSVPMAKRNSFSHVSFEATPKRTHRHRP
jgi:hypothetical protein